MSETDAIEYSLVDGIAIVTIGRPQKLNALRARDKRGLAERIGELVASDEVEAIVLTGAGERAFCVGSDIDEMRHFGASEMHAMLADERAMYRAALESPKPVVAAVNGYALGAGLILAMSTDYSVAAESAEVGLPELTIGVAAPLEGLLLPYLIGLARARELYYLGKRIAAAEAASLGLVNATAPAEQVIESAVEVAKRIAALPGSGFALQKQLLYRLISNGDLEGAIVESHYATSIQLGEGESGRAMSAFLDSR